MMDESRLVDRHEIDQGHAAVGRIEDGLQHHGAVSVGAADARLGIGWADPPSPVLGRAEQSRETGIAVEAWPAQPVDGAIATDQSGGRAIADQCIILDGKRQVGAHGRSDAAARLGAARGQPGIQIAHNLGDDVIDRSSHVRVDRMLVGAGLLQRCQLAVEQACRHEVPFARGEARGDQLDVAGQIEEMYVRSPASEEIAIAALECRAGNHAGLAGLPPAVDPVRDLFKPGPPVPVVERMSGVHLGDVRRRMEVVAFLEGPTESISERLCDRRLARSRNTHDHEDGSNAGDVGAGGLDHDLVGCRLGGPGSTIARSNHS